MITRCSFSRAKAEQKPLSWMLLAAKNSFWLHWPQLEPPTECMYRQDRAPSLQLSAHRVCYRHGLTLNPLQCRSPAWPVLTLHCPSLKCNGTIFSGKSCPPVCSPFLLLLLLLLLLLHLLFLSPSGCWSIRNVNAAGNVIFPDIFGRAWMCFCGLSVA